MNLFAAECEALDFLVRRIVAEAKRRGAPISEIERKMLYFSETDSTLPDMESVNAEFERNYDESEYEHRIGALITQIIVENRETDDEVAADWGAAVAKVSDGDRYLLVMIDMAIAGEAENSAGSGFIPTAREPEVRPPYDRLKLWLASFVVVAVILGMMSFWNWLYFHSSPEFQKFSDWLFDDHKRVGQSLLVLIVVGATMFGLNLKGAVIKFLQRK